MVWTGTLALVTALFFAPEPGDTGWRWPLRPSPVILRPFDPPAHPWEAGHRGVDLASRPGQPVYAAGPGRVGFARGLAGRGVVTVIHGRLRTTYLPVRPSVRAGQKVAAGTRIGVVENLLGHCGATTCLHWGLRQGAAYFDPLTLLGRGPVRLLPWWYGTEPPSSPVVGEAADRDAIRPGPGLADGPGPPERYDRWLPSASGPADRSLSPSSPLRRETAGRGGALFDADGSLLPAPARVPAPLHSAGDLPSLALEPIPAPPRADRRGVVRASRRPSHGPALAATSAADHVLGNRLALPAALAAAASAALGAQRSPARPQKPQEPQEPQEPSYPQNVIPLPPSVTIRQIRSRR